MKLACWQSSTKADRVAVNRRQGTSGLHHMLGAIPQRLREELVRLRVAADCNICGRLALRWSKAAVGSRERAASMFNLGGAKPEIIERYDAHLRAFRAYRPDGCVRH